MLGEGINEFDKALVVMITSWLLVVEVVRTKLVVVKECLDRESKILIIDYVPWVCLKSLSELKLEPVEVAYGYYRSLWKLGIQVFSRLVILSTPLHLVFMYLIVLCTEDDEYSDEDDQGDDEYSDVDDQKWLKEFCVYSSALTQASAKIPMTEIVVEILKTCIT
ncbi:hypothetical protein C5167_001007 [Papaver somniferum]|uniref:Uncharacterized protein n=1 Tax=Papaver somniferum TaxID=3469 RepID=A0A4Y7KWV1_PAPSO|nr:hypothetical protein C5167_001007 [Papaver somniferum]